MKRRKTHFHRLPCGVSAILGNNGFVWLAPSALDVLAANSGEGDEANEASASGGGGGFSTDMTPVINNRSKVKNQDFMVEFYVFASSTSLRINATKVT